MKIEINKQKIGELLIDIVVIAAVVTFLWNLILPGILRLPTISYLLTFSVVSAIYILRYVYKSRLADESQESVVESNSSII
ncbi:MAG: hypothetical protein LBG19_07315 [Prevotellaceae bacterium]|jgi:RsiW-degrading membrane proteinase PrsW (M82 family)|nr:hypothetical protein [Prevotellaceae bacterium]